MDTNKAEPKHDFIVGWVSFIEAEVRALREAQASWKMIFEQHKPAWKAEHYEDLKTVSQVLDDATVYIALNIGRVNAENPSLPSVKSSQFRLINATRGRIYAALLDLNATYESLPVEVRRGNLAAAHAEVREALTALYRHVEWVVNYLEKQPER